MITIPGVDPIWMWVGFIVLIFLLLELDLGILNKKDHVIGVKEALMWSAFWISLAMVFNAYLWWQFGSDTALEFFTGYVIEKSLSVDNLFVFLLIFSAFSIPRIYQHRVLFWGIIGAIVMRGIFIAAGSALVARFQWIFILFGLFLLYGAYRMFFHKEEKFDPEKSLVVRLVRKVVPVSHKIEGHHLFIKENGKWTATILFVALVVIEATDVVFATDSIPAIFAITTDPFIVFTSNIFAILGLRSLYFALAGMHSMFVYLKTGLAVILAFIGVKMLLYKVFHMPVWVSLLVILSILTISIMASILKNRSDRKHGRPPKEIHPEDVTGSALGGGLAKGHHLKKTERKGH